MKIKLTGSLSGSVKIISVEEAIEVINDAPDDEQVPAGALRRAWERGEAVDTYYFCAEPVQDDDDE